VIREFIAAENSLSITDLKDFSPSTLVGHILYTTYLPFLVTDEMTTIDSMIDRYDRAWLLLR
jgi:hypothetical protein